MHPSTVCITISELYVLQYGKEYEFDAPVKLLEKHLHAMAQSVDEQLVVVSQVGFFLSTSYVVTNIILV